MAERDPGAVDVEDIFVLHPPAFQDGKGLSRERFIELDQVDFVPGKSGPAQQFLHCRHRTKTHPRRVAAGRGPAHEKAERLQAERFQLVLGNHQTGRGGIVLLAGIAGRNGPAFNERLQLAHALQAGIGANALILVENDRWPLALRNADGHDFAVEPACRPGRGGAMMALHGEPIGRLAGDIVIPRQVFGGLDHAGDDSEPFDRLRAFPPAIQPVIELHRPGAGAVSHIGGVVFDIAHALHAAGEHDIGSPGLHRHRGVDDRLQTAAAAPVNLAAWHFDR